MNESGPYALVARERLDASIDRINIRGQLGVGVTAPSEADALQLFSLAFGSAEKIISIEIIKDMNDLDQNHVVPNLGAGNWLRRGIWFPQGQEHIAN